MTDRGEGIPTERQTHRAILKMVERCFPRVFTHHSPNGAHLAGTGSARFKQVGALKGDGMRVGFPDILCLWNISRSPPACLIEVKREKGGKLSDAQVSLHAELEALGWPVKTVRSVDEAFDFIRSCGAPWNGIDPRGVAG